MIIVMKSSTMFNCSCHKTLRLTNSSEFLFLLNDGRGRFPRVFGDEFGDKFSDKFGDKFSDSPNLVTNVVTNLVTNLVNHQNR